MDFDDDAPPDLVDMTTGGGAPEEELTVKVPITIVTGMQKATLFLANNFVPYGMSNRLQGTSAQERRRC